MGLQQQKKYIYIISFSLSLVHIIICIHISQLNLPWHFLLQTLWGICLPCIIILWKGYQVFWKHYIYHVNGEHLPKQFTNAILSYISLEAVIVLNIIDGIIIKVLLVTKYLHIWFSFRKIFIIDTGSFRQQIYLCILNIFLEKR